MTDNRVASNILGQSGALEQFCLFQEKALDTAVLIAELYFEVQNLFAVANETEVSRLNYSRMNWPHSHFVKFLAINLIKRIVSH